MKLNLGSKPEVAMPMDMSKPWYPTLCLHVKNKKAWKVGDTLEADVKIVVCGVRKESDGKGLCVDVEVQTIELEEPETGMEKMGY
jgi:hypothetical protein